MARIFDDSVEDEKSKVKKDGLIYQQRNDTDYKAEYEKLDSKGKFQFFKDYYLQTIVVIAVLVIVGGYYLYGSLTKPQTVLYVAVCDDNLDEKQVEKLEKAVGTYLGLDNKHEIVTINTDYNSSNGTLSEQLQSYIYAGTCDVVIAPKKGFMSYASAGYFLEPDTSDTLRCLRTGQEKKRLYCPWLWTESRSAVKRILTRPSTILELRFPVVRSIKNSKVWGSQHMQALQIPPRNRRKRLLFLSF